MQMIGNDHQTFLILCDYNKVTDEDLNFPHSITYIIANHKL